MVTEVTCVFRTGGISSKSVEEDPIYDTGPVQRGQTKRPVLGFSIGIVPHPLQTLNLTPSERNI